MLIQILKGTPTWVFVLFFALLALGCQQSRPHTRRTRRLLVLPAAFVAFSLFGVVSAFGSEPLALVAWAAGIAAAVVAQRSLGPASAAKWDASTGTFLVPGSWVPLMLMMTVFFIRYALTVTMRLQPGLANETAFALSASLLYGMLSGAFLARSLQVLSVRRPLAAPSVQST